MNLSNSAELKNKEYRHGLVNAQIEVDLPLQIRALRKQIVGTQPDMATLTGMKQPRISAMEKPGEVHFTLETLRRLAEAFDVALIVRFAPFSELLDWSGKFNPDTFRVQSFTDEAREVSEAEKTAAASTTQSTNLKYLAGGSYDPFGLIQKASVEAARRHQHETGLDLQGLGGESMQMFYAPATKEEPEQFGEKVVPIDINLKFKRAAGVAFKGDLYAERKQA